MDLDIGASASVAAPHAARSGSTKSLPAANVIKTYRKPIKNYRKLTENHRQYNLGRPCRTAQVRCHLDCEGREAEAKTTLELMMRRLQAHDVHARNPKLKACKPDTLHPKPKKCRMLFRKCNVFLQLNGTPRGPQGGNWLQSTNARCCCGQRSQAAPRARANCERSRRASASPGCD